MKLAARVIGYSSLAILCLLLPQSLRADDTAAGLELFEKKIRPVLSEHCYQCHAADSKQVRGGLRVDTREAIRSGGDSGAAVVPGEVEESLIIGALKHETFEMPPDNKLPAAIVADFEEWIRLGAPDPREGPALAKVETSIDWEQGRQWWAFQPIAPTPPPSVQDAAWPIDPVDQYLLAEMEARGLAPAQPAERAALLRRVHFVLHGLPPKPEELAAFEADDSPHVMERVVDQLLESPRFGERWGRHWLDVVRFAESSGGGRTLLFHDAWRYRDYVIEAFNNDQPFDQFIREQIAGDLLPAADRHERAAQLTATGFLALGPTNYELQDKELLRMEVIDEQIDTIGRSFLGLTIGCARCHDHKFDPIATEDYYGLAGIFRSTKSLVPGNVSGFVTTPLPLPPAQAKQLAAHEKRVEAKQAEIQQVQQQLAEVKQALANLGRGEVNVENLKGIVLDNDVAQLAGEWTASTSTSGFVGANYLHDGNTDQGKRSATWQAALPAPGEYEVRLSYTASSNRTSKAHVTVHHAKGETVKLVNQRELSPITGNFAVLGKFTFAKEGGSVVLSNQGSDGHVIADAVQFIPLQTELAAQENPPVDEQAKQLAMEVEQLSQQAKQLDEQVAKHNEELKELQKQAPKQDVVMSVHDESNPADYHICIRGNAHILGEVTPRSALRVVDSIPELTIPEGQSGRLQLADWIADQRNPLTARVYVNRVWQHVFGRGLVTTPDNFGASGEQPSHAALLDRLAADFIAGGWRTKGLVRRLLLTRAFAMSSQASLHAKQADPENVYLSHYRRQRLDAEAIRDSLLYTAGNLDLAVGGPSMQRRVGSEFGYRFDGKRRSVYVPRFRNTMPAVFTVFDVANPNLVTGRRTTSTLSTQALFFMNSAFVLEQAEALASQLIAQPQLSNHERIKLAYRTLLSRSPNGEELALASEFLAEMTDDSPDAIKSRWLQFCHTLYCSAEFRYIQ